MLIKTVSSKHYSFKSSYLNLENAMRVAMK